MIMIIIIILIIIIIIIILVIVIIIIIIMDYFNQLIFLLDPTLQNFINQIQFQTPTLVFATNEMLYQT